MPTPLEIVLGAAESAIGVGYRWGGNSLATGVDCSGLIQQAFLAAGIRIPRVSASQMRVGVEVASIEDAQPGDLVGYQTGDRNGAGVEHVAMYIGNGMMIEAYRTGEPVRVTQVRPGATFRRVLGHIDAGTPGAVTLGPNQDRTFTAAALGVGPGTPPAGEVVAASAVTAPPEGGLGDDLPDNATPEETEAYIKEHFPDLAGLMGNDEIRYVLTWAVREDKGDAEIRGALQQTRYYQEHSATSRAVDLWLAEQGTGSAEVARITDLAKGRLSDLFARNGITPDDATLSKLAMQALRSGDITLQGQVMNPDGLNSLVAFGLGKAAGNLPAGETSFTADRLMQIARGDYLVPMTRRAADEWAVRMLNGQATEESFRADLQRRAADQYGWLRDQIDKGTSPRAAMDGVISQIAGVLEMDPDTIDLLDSKWNEPLKMWDEKAKTFRSMTEGEAYEWARRRPEFRGTQRWKQEKGDTVSRLREWAGVAA